MTSRPDLIERLLAQLSPGARIALDICVGTAEASGTALYLVGGAVRDLLRGESHVDLDLAVEGDVAAIASSVAMQTNARVVTHPRFGTATVKTKGLELDLARTRRETYARPGALPDVEPASLADDLSRRDFTVNAMALQLTLERGRLIDPFGGQRDLEARLIRVLHEASFQDDATRMLRAARYTARFGFSLEETTATWLRRHLSYMDAISPARVRRELELLCKEPSAPRAAEIADQLGAMSAINPLLVASALAVHRWREALAGTHYAPLDEFGLCMITAARMIQAQVDELSERLHSRRAQKIALRDYVELMNSPREGLAFLDHDPVSLDASLGGRSAAAIWAAAYSSPQVDQACLTYLREWRHLRPHLDGKDLIALGVSPGPPVGAMLKALRAARLREQTRTLDDEIALVQRELGVVGG